MSFWKKIGWLARDPAPEAQRIRRAIKIAILVVLFAGLFWMIPIQQVIQAILNAKPAGVVIGCILGMVGTLLMGVEMEPLTRKQGIQHNLWEITEINLAVKFYNQFTPTALVGTGLRWYRLAQPGNKIAQAFAAMAFYRLVETFLTFALGLGFWLASGHQNGYVSVGWMVAVIIAIILFWIVLTRYSLPLYNRLKAHSAGLLEQPLVKPFSRKLEKLLAAISAYADIPAWDLFVVVGAGAASVFAGVASGTSMARAVGIDIGFMQMGWIQAIVLTATQLPFAVAGGVGIRDVTLVALLSTFGISPELALAYSFLLLIRGVVISLFGGVWEGLRALKIRETPAAAAPAVTPPTGESSGAATKES